MEGVKPFALIIPVFNDWETVVKLLEKLEQTFAVHALWASLILIDDGSSELPSDISPNLGLPHFVETRVLRLRKNLGHQRALAIGIAWAEKNLADRAVVIMDGDGEDAPEDIPRLLRKMTEQNGQRVIFAERTLRSEGIWFRFGYLCFRALHLALTGRGIRFGNFSVIPPSCLPRLVVVSELWSHYAAAVVKSGIPFDTIATHRRKRITGTSKMSFPSLVVHGLSALSVQGDVIGVRLVIESGVGCIVALGWLLTTLFLRGMTHSPLSGWSPNAAGILVLALLQTLLLSLFFSFLTLQGRTSSSFIPVRDFGYFVMEELHLKH